jgi:hypothetical protein
MVIMSNTDEKKEYKIIKISKKNYDVLNNLGKTNSTFNSVLTRILERNNLLTVVTEEED